MAMFPLCYYCINGKFVQMMEIDEQLMKILPKKTDGKYFRTASVIIS
jgi:hypothetical protein